MSLVFRHPQPCKNSLSINDWLRRLTTVSALTGCILSLQASSFRSGELFYTILDKSTVEVSSPDEGEEYSGMSYTIPSVVEHEGQRYIVKGIGGKAFLGCKYIQEVAWPETIEWIGNDAFNGCGSLGPNIDFISDITIGHGAFSYCRGIRELNLSVLRETPGEGAFMGCTGLEEVYFNNEMEQIPAFLFKDCTSLATISLPSDLKIIEEQAFSGCTRLSEILIPVNVKVIGERAFSNCNQVATLTLMCKDAEIGEGGFEHLQSLESLYLTGISTVGKSAFEGCIGMKWVEIDHGMEAMGRLAFSGCKALETVYSHPENPPMIYQDTFDSYTEQNAWLMVARGTWARYDMASYWSRFGHIEETEIFPVETKSIFDEKMPEVWTERGEVRVTGNERPVLISMTGQQEQAEKLEWGWIFRTSPGVYVLWVNGRGQKVLVK